MTQELEPKVLKRSSSTIPKVSILCSTYNQDQYISFALESFLSQETSFEYEIVVHDDASTDSTPKILREYYEKHSDKMTVVFQRENQYSKGHFEPVLVEALHADADVFVICDGDDYFISPKKLQYQMDRLEAYPDVELAFHPVYKEFPNGTREIFCRHSDEEYVFSTNRVITGTGGFCPTVSLMITRRALFSIPQNVLSVMPVGDVFIQLYGAAKGGALYLPEPLAVYRVNSATSVSSSLAIASIDRKIRSNIDMAQAYAYARHDLPFQNYWALLQMEYRYRIKKNRKLRRAL
jgi:glycosyltransferase involved in cell wall biosynthesis